MKREVNINDIVLSLIPDKRRNAKSSKQLMELTGLKFRHLKQIIAELRIFYPICSQETEGGGYWIAENAQDLKEFINMISRRRDGYNKTIEIMTNHIYDGGI